MAPLQFLVFLRPCPILKIAGRLPFDLAPVVLASGVKKTSIGAKVTRGLRAGGTSFQWCVDKLKEHIVALCSYGRSNSLKYSCMQIHAHAAPCDVKFSGCG